MKRLALLRHAKSSWDNPDLSDHDRPLNGRGCKAARRMGREMADRGMRFDYVLASTAKRVRETLEGVGQSFPIQAPVSFEPKVYEATQDELLALVHGLDECIEAPLLVGHNSGLEELIAGITHDDEAGLRDRCARKFPTAALAVIDLPVGGWAEVKWGSGEIVELIVPRELD